MKALIDPSNLAQYTSEYIVSTEDTTGWKRVEIDLPGSGLICDKKDTQYDVAAPCFWVDCADDLDINESYYDIAESTIKAKPNAPMPTSE